MYKEFPTPLINRLEKHFVLYSSVLEDWQTHVLREMEHWIKDFSDVQSTNTSRYVMDSVDWTGILNLDLPTLYPSSFQIKGSALVLFYENCNTLIFRLIH